MLTLYRKVRQRLLAQNNFSRHLLYAIGEIFLVVVGILIALHLPAREATAEQAGVNNWNEDQKKRTLEEKILLEMNNNLATDLVEISDEVESFQVVIEPDSILLEHFRAGRPFSDSIGALLHVALMSPHMPPVKSGYKLLESNGIELITDVSLRMQITDLYEWEYPYYAIYAGERFHAIENMLQPYWVKHFYIERHDKWPYRKRVPIEYARLLNNPEFIPMIQTSLFQAAVMKGKSTNLKAEVEPLRENIQKYLEKLSPRNAAAGSHR